MIVLRLLIVPLAVFAVAGAQRRLGPAAGGRLIGLPLTTGPFLLLLGLDSGPLAAANAAVGAVIGQLSAVAFCGCYGLMARRGLRPSSADPAGRTHGATSGSVGSALAVSLLTSLTASGLAVTLSGVSAGLAVVLVAVVGLGLAALIGPGDAAAETSAVQPGPRRASETLLRIGITETVVVTMLGLSAVVGAELAGVLSALPVILAVMLPTTHRTDGAAAAALTARSTLVALPSTTGALFVAGVALPDCGPFLSCGLASITLVGLNLVAGAALLSGRTTRTTPGRSTAAAAGAASSRWSRRGT